MHLLWTLLIGLVIGAVAKFLMPGKDPGGFIVTMLIGIAGSFIATYVGRALGWYQEGQSAGFIMSVLGAIVLLGVYHLVRRKRLIVCGGRLRPPPYDFGESILRNHALDTGGSS